MLKPRDLKFFAIGALIVASGLSVFAAVNIPNTFTPNTPIKAEEVNANFSSLKASIEALQASSGTVADGTLTSSKFADGAITSGKLTDGAVISSKLADASVSASKLITSAPASSGKFLSFDGSSLSWADGTAGTVGPQGPKGDTGAAGVSGLQGAKGDTGAIGPQGAKGDAGAVGATGQTGAAGVSGYERVVISLFSQALGANMARGQVISCPSGKRVVGGGFKAYTTNTDRWVLGTNDPISDTQWEISVFNLTGATISATQLDFSAICVTAL